MKSFIKSANGFYNCEKWEPNCWVNVVCPDESDKNYLLNEIGIPEPYYNDIEDVDERPRIELEDGWFLIILRVPYKSEDHSLPFSTVPMGLIFKDDVFVSICFYKTEMIPDFINYGNRKATNIINNFDLVLKLLLSSSVWFLKYLKQINQRIKLAENKLEKSIKNEELQTLLMIEKCMVFFTTSLKGNDILIYKIKNIKEHRETYDKELLEDVEIELRQAQETTKIIIENDREILKEVSIDSLHKGDLLKVNEGSVIPLDGLVERGEGHCDESMISGESLPVSKIAGSMVTGGTHLIQGNIRLVVTRNSRESVLAGIIEMVKQAQQRKPKIQQTGDRVSAIFVPVVIGISLLTFLVSYLYLDLGSAQSMMRAVAVLVISCPCAMGLATPTAVMVGIGKAARRGILIKGGDVLENFARVEQIVFDKTGTLSTGHFTFSNWKSDPELEPHYKNIFYQLETHSNHPIAKALVQQHPEWNQSPVQFEKVEEIKGVGMFARDAAGMEWRIGQSNEDQEGDLVLFANEQPVASCTMADEMKENAEWAIDYFHKQGIKTTLLSGDKESKVSKAAKELGIDSWYSQQKPDDKYAYMQKVSGTLPVAMVGDGINDAPALSKATVAISFSKASDIAIQSANLVVIGKGLETGTGNRNC